MKFPRRSLLYVPGSDGRKLQKLHFADTVIYDLEDSVSNNKNVADMKSYARELVCRQLSAHSYNSLVEQSVRINASPSAVGDSLQFDDLSCILKTPNLNSIVLPKVDSPDDIKQTLQMIGSILSPKRQSEIRLLVSIESARGLENINEIISADKRIDAVIFAAEDYCADTGILRTDSLTELNYVRQRIINSASSHKIQAIDLVCVDFKSPEILKRECKQGREFGFTGKQAIHPNQIETINHAFSPLEEEIKRANAIIKGFNEYGKKGVGAFELNGKMIDMPVVKWAMKLLEKEQALNQLKSNQK